MARKLKPTCGRCGGEFSAGMLTELVDGKEHHSYCAGAVLAERGSKPLPIVATLFALCFFPWLSWAS